MTEDGSMYENIEKIMAVAVFPVAFLYSSIWYDTKLGWNAYLGLFVLGILVLGEIFYKDVKRTWESYAFLAMTIVSSVAVTFSIGSVWEEMQMTLFTHLFGLYWIMVRSGRLSEGNTSHMFVWDGFMGFVKIPFTHFTLWVKTLRSLVNGDKKRINISKLIPALIASFVGITLLAIAVVILRSADANYNALMRKISNLLSIEWDVSLIWRLIFSTVFASYFYGLMGGSYREDAEYATRIGDQVKSDIAKLSKVVPALWVCFIGLFSAFYILYFALQASFLFGAFKMILPAEYSYSSYARHGFGEMCAVMVINFLLLWCATRTGEKITKTLKAACTLLVGESMVFAIIAFMKLLMYIVAYGFTPLRLQSAWLITILTFACVCVLISMYLNKKTARVWFVTSSALLCALCLV